MRISDWSSDVCSSDLNGRAHLDTEPALLASFEMDGKPPRSVIVVAVEKVFFQCARAIIRSELWNPARHVDPKSLPTPGQIRSEERRVGKECVSTCRSRWSPDH